MSIQSVNIVFFSGTGGTKRAAESFKNSFISKNISVNTLELNGKQTELPPADYLLILFPIYACNAPIPIFEWIEHTKSVNDIPTAVISCSGGGTCSPNTACRISCIKKLKSKGYNVLYDTMIVLPSNWIVRGDDRLMIILLRALQLNTEKIADDILNGTKSKNKPLFIDRLFSMLGKQVKNHAKQFGQKIKVTENCIGCGLCVKKCPRENITIVDGKPVYSDRCVICLNCIYSCPQKALEPSSMKFVVIKKGFDIDSVERKYGYATDLPDYKELTKGWVWRGVRKYLAESEKLK